MRSQSAVSRLAGSHHRVHHFSWPRRRLKLLERALFGSFVGPPAYQFRAMAEAIAGDMIVAHFDDKVGPQRLPFGGAFGAPAARRAGRVAGEAGWLDESFEPLRQYLAAG